MSVIGEALVDVMLHSIVTGGPRLRRVLDWIVDGARPPVGVRLVTDDGTEYTGFVLVEANRPRLMFALRVGAVRGVVHGPTRYATEPRYVRHDFDAEVWPRGDDPYR